MVMWNEIPSGVCRHCNTRKKTRPRGLCWRCWHDSGIRSQYPPKLNQWDGHSEKVKCDGYGKGNPSRKPASFPTPFSAGTVEKLVVMRGRARRGESLFHEQDDSEGGTGRTIPPVAREYRRGIEFPPDWGVGDPDSELDATESK